jgi:hypothetical protein
MKNHFLLFNNKNLFKEEIFKRQLYLKQQSYKTIPLLKTVPKHIKQVVDGTAGLLEDSLWFLARGLSVHAFEKNPYIFEKISYYLPIENLTYTFGDSIMLLEDSIEFLYLDPFFEQKKSKSPKNMDWLKHHSHEEINKELLCKKQIQHLVIKRYKHLPSFLEKNHDIIYGNKIRFELYSL